MRARAAPLRPAPGASEDGAAPNLLSICHRHRPARGPFAARLDRARTPKSSTEEAAAAAATEATCARHRRHATVCSSASLRSPWGRRRFDAAGVSNAAPTGTEAQAASHRCAGPAAPAGLRPPPIHPAVLEATGVRRWRPRFPLTGPGCVSGACVPRASFSASAADCRVQSARSASPSVCRVSE